MAIRYKPRKGQVLICDFQEAKSRRNSQATQRPGGSTTGQKKDLRGFVPPEMVKRRPVVVLSNKSSRLCTVVPFSTSAPDPVLTWHHSISGLDLPDSYDEDTVWAKCDLIYTVCFDRLFGLKFKNREYRNVYLEESDFKAVYKCVLEAIKP